MCMTQKAVIIHLIFHPNRMLVLSFSQGMSSYLSGEVASRLSLSFLSSSSGKPTISETGDLGDLPLSRDLGDLPALSRDLGDLVLGDLEQGLGLLWPGMGLGGWNNQH